MGLAPYIFTLAMLYAFVLVSGKASVCFVSIGIQNASTLDIFDDHRVKVRLVCFFNRKGSNLTSAFFHP